jgi:hypothetical protein
MRAYVFSVIWFGLCALAAPAFSQPYGPPPPPYGDRAGVQPLDRLLPGIRRAHPGDFYDAEGPTYGPSGDPHYHLKWMTPDGRVIWYDTDARSGRVLRSSPGRDSFDSEHSRGGPPPPGYGQPYDRGYGDRGYGDRGYGGPRGYGSPPGYGGAPYGGGAPYSGPRFVPRSAPPSGGWQGGGGWRGGGGGGGGGGWRGGGGGGGGRGRH